MENSLSVNEQKKYKKASDHKKDKRLSFNVPLTFYCLRPSLKTLCVLFFMRHSGIEMTQVRLYLSLQCFTIDLMTICNVHEDSETYKLTLTFVLSLVAPLSVIQTVSTSLDLGPNESQQVCFDTKISQ